MDNVKKTITDTLSYTLVGYGAEKMHYVQFDHKDILEYAVLDFIHNYIGQCSNDNLGKYSREIMEFATLTVSKSIVDYFVRDKHPRFKDNLITIGVSTPIKEIVNRIRANYI